MMNGFDPFAFGVVEFFFVREVGEVIDFAVGYGF
jgi:hypothetical protein